MELIRGKQTSWITTADLVERASAFAGVWIDLGTGDGRFVRYEAQAQPRWLVIGVDACRENLAEVSRRAPNNALFAIANAQRLPEELHGRAAQISVNFPWGSLLEGLLDPAAGVLDGLAAIARPGARLDVRLNGGALGEAGCTLEAGADQVRQQLAACGFTVRAAAALGPADLSTLPTTWARRLAHGRDPRGLHLRGTKR